MPLTPAQLATLKTHLLANTNQITSGGTTAAINAMPNTPDTAVRHRRVVQRHGPGG